MRRRNDPRFPHSPTRPDPRGPAGALQSALCLVPIIALLAPTLLGAQGQAPSFGEETIVENVLLDVRVTDSRGDVVLGLDESDFVVEEDGERVQIEDVTFYSNRRFLDSREVARDLGVDPDAVPTDRYFILFFHDQRRILPRLGMQMLDAARRAKQWAATELQPNDWVAVVSYFPKLKVQDFSNDPERIAAGIDAAVTGKDFQEFAQPAGAPTMAQHVPSLEGKSPDVYGALQAVADGAEHVPGRKNLVFFSIGFGDVDDFGLYVPDRRYFPKTTRALNDANVAVYAVDLIPSSSGMFSQLGVYESSLSNLAAETGGDFYFNFVNFIRPLEQISEHTNGYYLIAYERPRGEEGFQDVEVRVKNPRFEVDARKGYLTGG